MSEPLGVAAETLRSIRIDYGPDSEWHDEDVIAVVAEVERLRGVIERLEIEKHDLAERLADVEELVAAMRAHGISPEARERTNALIRSLGFGGTP